MTEVSAWPIGPKGRLFKETKYIETGGERLTAEELVDIAIKILHPALYNVADPKEFHKQIIQKVLALKY
jgi:hypothetical protein